MIIAIGGEPATGKTTIVTNIIKILGAARAFKYKKLRGCHFPSENLFILGIYFDGKFSGTDRLSMDIIDDTKSFVRKIYLKDNTVNILFEGDRLFNKTFLDFCKGYDLKVFITKCSDEQKRLRHIQRIDTQSEQFLKSRKTKLENLSKGYEFNELINETDLNKNQNIDTILKLVKRSSGVKTR